MLGTSIQITQNRRQRNRHCPTIQQQKRETNRHFHEFEHCFTANDHNKTVFDGCVKHLVNRSARAQWNRDSVFVCSGQSTSGKTHTIIGSNNEKGILQQCVEHLLNHQNVCTVSIQIMESYGRNKHNIQIFDILHPNGSSCVHFGKFDNHSQLFCSRKISEMIDMQMVIEQVRNEAHFAATARHSQSSRSHIVFRISITRNDGSVSNLIIVDCAGSDSHFVITHAFAQKSHPNALRLRRGECDVIGYSLNRFQQLISHYKNGKNRRRIKGNMRFVILFFFLIFSLNQMQSFLFPVVCCCRI